MNKTIDRLRQFKVFDDKQIEVLREKQNKYQKIVKFDLNGKGALYGEGVFIDMVEGKTIVLETT